MARPVSIGTKTVQKLNGVLRIQRTFQLELAVKPLALSLAEEYIFLSAYKIWEIFLENIFAAQSRYNDPVAGRRPYPFLSPRTEKHAIEIFCLEKEYIDWTNPDAVVERAEILFRDHRPITDPLKSNMQDLRDMKKIRNFVAHGSTESFKKFQNLTLSRIGAKSPSAGNFLLHAHVAGNTYGIFYLELLKRLIRTISH